ncbi:MAG: cation:proton antiporter [Methanobacterium paludis]|nr:cation:proton antiporter [Methanobacterium paludis]
MKDKVFISWVGIRGAVPIIFATYPIVAGVNGANMIFNIVFFITMTSALIQGSTINVLARYLGLSKPKTEK